MTIDHARVREAAEGYRADMTAFLRALIRNRGTSCQEEAKARLIVAEMEKLGYTSTRIDGLGSAIGTMGTGRPSSLSTATSTPSASAIPRTGTSTRSRASRTRN